jgi:hypothetical protein
LSSEALEDLTVVGEKTNFIVIFEGRAGSTYLMDVLNHHPEITARDEILDRAYRVLHPREKLTGVQKLYTIARRFQRGKLAEWQLKRAKSLYRDRPRKSRVVGFKTKLRYVVDPLGMKELLETSRIKTIVMDRNNFVQKAVAHIYGQRLYTNTKYKYGERAWNLFDESDRLGPQRIEVEEFDRMLCRVVALHQRLHAYADSLRVPKLNLEYAELLRDKNGWFRSVFDFLGVEPCQLESRVLQNEPDDLRKALANFEELRAHYVGTVFEPMFSQCYDQTERHFPATLVGNG